MRRITFYEKIIMFCGEGERGLIRDNSANGDFCWLAGVLRMGEVIEFSDFKERIKKMAGKWRKRSRDSSDWRLFRSTDGFCNLSEEAQRPTAVENGIPNMPGTAFRLAQLR